MGMLESLNQTLGQALYPGHREIRVSGYEQAEKYPMPRDCEAIFIDSDPKSDYIYMKITDANGGERFARYKIIEEPIPKFEPGKYVTTNDFNSFKEEVLDGINSIKQSIAAANGGEFRSARSDGGNKRSGRSDNGFGKSDSNVQPNGLDN